ncbi:universal stress protein [Flaviaesturariibacter flavus]|uniref:Universal stress protein n=1 Tax=Flaviaesturariibacter flavus TaxID=2502780 RepID=A0A4R1BNH2_9BACT|nr:universal stress protein [Flaviaesturariibacter flavus]TCJ19079.1 universal stress protein [Flaviaesturariibacter flavus]
MKKILLALSEERFSEEAFDFALGLNRLGPVQLTAAFIPQPVINGTWTIYGSPPEAIPLAPPLLQTDPEVFAAVKGGFERRCIANDIPYRTHEGVADTDLTELRKESRYADLLLLGTGGIFDKLFAQAEWDNLTRMLHALECPAIIVPENFRFPEKVIIAFDGSRDAAHAVKQFYSFLPELSALPTVVAYASKDKKDAIPDRLYLEELALQHFHDLTFTHLTGKPKEAIASWMRQQAHPILVSGAMGRGGLSRLFRESFVQPVLTEQQFPVFIAHS